MTPLKKQSKKAQKKANAAMRTQVLFNTGTRTMKTAKKPSRAMEKDFFRKSKEPLDI